MADCRDSQMTRAHGCKRPRPQSSLSKQGPWTVPMLLSMVSATVICSNHSRHALAACRTLRVLAATHQGTRRWLHDTSHSRSNRGANTKAPTDVQQPLHSAASARPIMITDSTQ